MSNKEIDKEEIDKEEKDKEEKGSSTVTVTPTSEMIPEKLVEAGERPRTYIMQDEDGKQVLVEDNTPDNDRSQKKP